MNYHYTQYMAMVIISVITLHCQYVYTHTTLAGIPIMTGHIPMNNDTLMVTCA